MALKTSQSIDHAAVAKPKTRLHPASLGGMRQTNAASSAVAASPELAATRPLRRATPMRNNTTRSGIVAASADSPSEWSGTSGWTHAEIPAGFTLRQPHGRRDVEAQPGKRAA